MNNTANTIRTRSAWPAGCMLAITLGLILPKPAGAQPAPEPAAPAPAAAPPAASPPETPPEMPAASAEPAPATPPPAAEPEPPPPPAAAETPAPEPPPAPLSVHTWGHIGSRLQSFKDPKKMDRLRQDGDLELHFDGAIDSKIGMTGNIAAVYGPSATGGDPQGTLAILDLIARFDIDDAFHIWVGRMLVPSDRANFSGFWFAAPWYYAGTFSPHGFIGPAEGPYGRNDGTTLWGQLEGGLFKYYVSAFNLYDGTTSPLWSGRLNLSLINPEPGYYHSSTYYGKDILAIAIGGQAQANGSVQGMPATGTAPKKDDYYEFNADVLFEKDLHDAGVIDLEGAVYKYMGDYQYFDLSYLLLASYMTADKLGPGKLQPLVRFQQGVPKKGDSDSSIEVQLGYVIEAYSARLALGFQHTTVATAAGSQDGNALYLGVQVMK